MAFSRGYNLLKMVEEFGEPLTLRKKTTAGTYDPTTGSVTGSATTDYNFEGYFYNYDQGIIANVDEIRRGTRKCVVPALGLAVEPDDEDQIIVTVTQLMLFLLLLYFLMVSNFVSCVM